MPEIESIIQMYEDVKNFKKKFRISLTFVLTNAFDYVLSFKAFADKSEIIAIAQVSSHHEFEKKKKENI